MLARILPSRLANASALALRRTVVPTKRTMFSNPTLRRDADRSFAKLDRRVDDISDSIVGLMLPSVWRDADRNLAMLDRIFDHLLPEEEPAFHKGLNQTRRTRKPLADLMMESLTSDKMSPILKWKEIEDGFFLTATTPGLKKEELEVEVVKTGKNRNYVVLKGQSKKEEESLPKQGDEQPEKEGANNKPPVYFKRSEYKFEEKVLLPEGIDPDSIMCKYEDGLLQVHLKHQDKLPKVERKKISL